MIINEFAKYNIIDDKKNPFSICYNPKEDIYFYIEPVFSTQLLGFKEQFPNRYNEIIEEIERIVFKNKKVIFTGNYDFPLTKKEGFIILEITDVTDRIKLFAEDKSRGSDYGD